ncbi:MAG: porin [Campylobacterota bacterium]|nr:porin [Campylobacterota bacterium]
MRRIILSLAVASTLSMAATNEELYQEIQSLKSQMSEMKKSQSEQNDALLEEIANTTLGDDTTYESFSSMGEAASKVYHSDGAVSIGGYGEYKLTKYNDFKNYSSDTANETRNKTEFNIVRFVPYIGFKFNDWIVMNTEIEFEDGGARSDDTKNYKYAIVEFSYLDFLIEKEFAIRVGHILVPFGLVNLNHEPVAFLTSDRPAVETFIIPATWHTNGLLSHGKIDSFEYYAGIVSSPDAGAFVEGRFIQQGRLGARQFTDDVSFVARSAYDFAGGLNAGASVMYGNSTALAESKPGTSTGHTSDSSISMAMAEAHITYNNHGFDIQALATYGQLGGDVGELSSDIGEEISTNVNGQYITVGYDVLNSFSSSHKMYVVGEVERLDMDASNDTTYSDNNKFNEYTAGLAYFPDPKVVMKANYKVKDYASGATLADESSFVMSAGFIF